MDVCTWASQGKVERPSKRGRHGSGIGLLHDKYPLCPALGLHRNRPCLWVAACSKPGVAGTRQAMQQPVWGYHPLPIGEGIGLEKAGPSLDMGAAAASFPHWIFLGFCTCLKAG